MRIRSIAAAAGIGVGVAAVAAIGTAQAATPKVLPDIGAAGVAFNHQETVALAGTPVPNILGMGLLAPITSVHVDEHSSIEVEGGRVHADMPTVFQDAAAQPNGRITIAVVDPTRYNGKVLLVGSYY